MGGFGRPAVACNICVCVSPHTYDEGLHLPKYPRVCHAQHNSRGPAAAAAATTAAAAAAAVHAAAAGSAAVAATTAATTAATPGVPTAARGLSASSDYVRRGTDGVQPRGTAAVDLSWRATCRHACDRKMGAPARACVFLMGGGWSDFATTPGASSEATVWRSGSRGCGRCNIFVRVASR